MKKLIDHTWQWNTDKYTIKEVLEDYMNSGLPNKPWTSKQAKLSMMECWSSDDNLTEPFPGGKIYKIEISITEVERVKKEKQ